MTLAAKKRVLAVALAVTTLWPLGHIALVHVYEVNPWAWWGWAMYTEPPPRVSTIAYSTRTGRPIEPGRIPSELVGGVRAAYEAFQSERMAYGALREPVDFARALLRAVPGEPGVRLAVERVELDPESGMLKVAKTTEYEYSRADLGL